MIYASENAPHEALGRAARTLSRGGALYLGGGVGLEKVVGPNRGESFRLTRGGKVEKTVFPGALSAVIAGFSAAGGSTAADTPGGVVSVPDAAVAARLRELADELSERRRSLAMLERRVAARAAREQGGGWLPGARDDDGWDQRRRVELGAEIAALEAERGRLIAAGAVEEVEQARPGTNFTKIPAQNVKRLAPLVKHYAGKAHPFTACVADQVKHGLSEDHAKRRCAVVKDLGRGTTNWRGKAKESELELVVAGAGALLETVESVLGVAVVLEGSDELGGLRGQVVEAVELLAACDDPYAVVLAEAFATAPSAAAQPSGLRAPRKPTAPGADAEYDDEKHPRGKKGTSEGGRFVKKGAKGEDVHAIQRRVGAKTDGEFGDDTEKAVREFQRRHGLKVDGIVGHQTAVALAGNTSGAKDAKVGALKGSDVSKLRRMRRKRGGGERRGRAPERRGGGRMV